MGYKVRVERDSVDGKGENRLCSMVIQFPRVVLAEAITHRRNYDSWEVPWGEGFYFCERTTTRDISKNSASSRAIPTERMLRKVWEDPYIPEWTLNQKGMQGEFVSDPELVEKMNFEWLASRNEAVKRVKSLADLGAHKGDANRLLEPYLWITQIVTSSHWDNFFGLRCHKDAHPALRKIARLMYVALQKSTPRVLQEGQWHLPFVPLEEQDKFQWFPDIFYENDLDTWPDLVKFSAARCGWISYENADKDGTREQMLNTFKRFIPADGSPAHGSVFEHQATPMSEFSANVPEGLFSNLTGWLQLRKLMPREEIKKYSPSPEEVASWGVDESLIEVIN